MKKKIMALMLIIPIIFLIALFSVGKIAGVVADIPVTGIRITTQSDDGFIDVDLAGYEESPIYLTAQVEPQEAKNQNYYFEVTGVNGEEVSGISVGSDGKLEINDVGSAKVTAISAEKGYKDSVIVNVSTTKVISITPLLNDGNISKEGGSFKADLLGGIYNFSASIYPNELSGSSVVWSSSNSDILEINSVTGIAKAKLSGDVKVIGKCENGVEGTILTEINTHVSIQNTKTGMAINGLCDNSVIVDENGKTFSFVVEKTNGLSDDIEVFGISANITKLNDTQYKIVADIPSGHADTLDIEVALSGKKSTLKVTFASYAFDIVTTYHRGGNNIYQKNKSSVAYTALSEIEDNDIDFDWEIISGDDILSLTSNNQMATISAKDRGTGKIKVSAKRGGEVIYSVEKDINVVMSIYSVEFTNNSKEYGIENILAVGSKRVSDGSFLSDATPLTLRIKTEKGIEDISEKNDGIYKITYESNDKNIIRTLSSADYGKILVQASGDGVTELYAKYDEYNAYFGTSFSTKCTLRGVMDGVNISSYSDLKVATDNAKRIVLKNDIMLGEGMSLEELKGDVKTIKTTYDWTYYLNKDGTCPEVMYIVEFTGDVFGNGYEINADNFTMAVDGTGLPEIFKGPLDFVAISMASVKAQDNIVFLVRNNITIDNVILKGCKDESLYSDGSIDLTKLNYAGTTLEIMNDCNIYNSRIGNGRTNVRIFGKYTAGESPVVNSVNDIKASDERLHVNIESCVLYNAREFILKIGANRAIKENAGVQKLLKEDGSAYSPFDSNNMTDSYFYDHYVENDVTLKDSVLETSGLFAIGMETHFSGAMLMSETVVTNWQNTCATSYASALRLVGDVKILDWKKLSSVDSSTLIETNAGAYSWLTLDVARLIEEVRVQTPDNEQVQNIISNIDGENYVHGGIAFYGGGLNYSYLDMSAFTSEKLTKYNINISILANSDDEDIKTQGSLLPNAAGNSDFVFYMYNATSNFNYTNQQQLKTNGYKITRTIF